MKLRVVGPEGRISSVGQTGPIVGSLNQVGCCQSTVRQVLKCRQDYEVDGPLYC